MSNEPKAWSAGRPLLWGFLTIAILVVGLGGWSVLTTLAGAIIAHGQVEVTQSRQVVQHPDGGIVTEILVREGATVQAGDVLMRIDGDQLLSELAIVQNQLLEFGARRARLEAERDGVEEVVFPSNLLAAASLRADIAELVEGQRGLRAAHHKAIQQATEQRQIRIEQIRNQIAGIDAEGEALDRQTSILKVDLATQKNLLADGLTEAARLSALEREIAELEGRRGALIASRAEAAGRITEIEIEVSSLVTQQREEAETELRDIVAKETELIERQHALTEKISRLDVLAPAAGIVLGLHTTTPQSVIRPADILMYIVPQDRPLLVAAKVPVTHVDEIKVGQDVRLVFSSLPSRTTPELHGQVTLVSADALTEERTGQNYYRAEISIDPKSIEDLQGVSIVPGMPVEAYIKTEDRTPLSYLLKPFSDYFRQAFRET